MLKATRLSRIQSGPEIWTSLVIRQANFKASLSETLVSVT